MMSAALFNRLWDSVDRKADDECWEWTGRKMPNGYGMVCAHQQREYAHRLSWFFHNGETKLFVLHRCDNPACVNPKHLFVGTQTDNMRDKVAKGRQRGPKGMYNYEAKLTDDAVREIRRRWKPGLGGLLARQFDVSHAVIWRAANGFTWKHVK